MAVTYEKSNDFKFINTWTQLRDIVSQKSLFNEADYQGLTASQKEQYLLQLYKNNDALAARMGDEYYSEYGYTQTRYSAIVANGSLIDYETTINTEEGKALITEQFNKEFNATIAKDIDTDQAWIKDLVESQYDGNYAKFLKDYSSDKGYNDLLLAQIPSATDVTEESFNEDISKLSETYENKKLEYDNSVIEAYKNTKQYIQEKLQANARQQVYDNAGALEKTLNTLWQLPAAWVAELGNIVEGVVDVLATPFGSIGSVENFIKKDIIALDTMILNATDESWLSAYADDNIAKTIHEIGVSIVDMTPLVLDNIVPGLGSTIYYASAAGRTMESELQSGYSYSEALTYTIASTAISWGTEQLSSSPFFNKGKSIIGKWLSGTKLSNWYTANKNWATEIVRQSLGEGLEEVVEGIGSGIAHGIITGDYQVEGDDLWKSFLIGGIVGGIMAGGNQIYRHAIVTKTNVKLTNSNGNSINLSVGKAQVVSEYVKKLTEKIKAGKTLSKKEQTRYDILKDIKINTLLDRKGNALSYGKVYTIQDIIEQTVDINKRTKTYSVSVEKGYFDAINKTEDKIDDFKKQAEALAERAKSAEPNEADFTNEPTDLSQNTLSETSVRYAYDLTNEEDIARAQQDFTTNGVLTLSKMMKMFGEDAVVQGIESYSKWADKTIDEVISLLTVGTDNSEFMVAKDTKGIKALKSSFNNAEFILVNPRKSSLTASKADEITKTVRLVKNKLNSFMRSNEITGKIELVGTVKFFVTTDPTVSTSFFVDEDLYINANWLADRDINFVKDIIVLKLLSQNARLSFKSESTKNILRSIVSKLDLKNRSADIVEQELAVVLLYTKNNPLMQQLLAMTDSKMDRLSLIHYFNTLQQTYADIHVNKAAGSALTNIASCAEALFDIDSTENSFSERQNNGETAEEILLDYINRSFRAFPGVTGNKGIPVEYAKLNVMYLHFKNKFGFNKELDLQKDIDWLSEFNNPSNYSPEGYNSLKAELEKFQPVISGTGFEIGTIKTQKSFNELLNYYLDMYCGVMITHQGIISSDDFITKILNMNAIDIKLATYNEQDLSREPIGKISDFVTSYAKDRLSAEVLSAEIYLYVDSKSSSTAFINGTPGSGMQIFLNLPSLAKDINTPHDIGGVRILLDPETGLPIMKDNKYEIDDSYRQTVSKAASTFAHEIGHAIGMSLGLQGTFGTNTILNAWSKRFGTMNAADRKTFINSIVEWLFEPDGLDLKTDKVNFESFVDAKSWRNKLSKINSSNITSILSPLARYLYFSGFAHELYAGSLGNKESEISTAAAFARTDLIQSRTTWNKKDSTTILYLDDNFKSSAPEFIKVLDGYTMQAPNSSFNKKIDEIMNSTENVTRRIYSHINNIQELKEEFGIELDSDLINPDFWRGKMLEAKVDTSNSDFITRESLISDIESAYDCTYENDTFVSGFVSNSIRFADVKPDITTDYNCVFYNDGSIKSTRDDAAYVNESNIDAIAIYHPAQGRRPADVTIRLNTTHLSKLTRARLDEVLKLVPNKRQRYFIADGRTFITPKAAMEYLSNASTKSNNAEFEVLFDKIIKTAITTGRQKEYAGDIIYMTSDGKIYNTNSNMATWNGIAESMNTPKSVLGEYTQDDNGAFKTDNPENITYNLSNLLDEKKILRLYRNGENWIAYGIPNQMQDVLIRELHAERKSETPYLDIESNRRLFVNSKGDQHVEIHGINWKNEGFKEVEWKNNKWYECICQIMTKYNINKFEDFKRLGFSNEFIARLQSTVGVERTNKYGETYLQPGGINYKYILEYIGDNSNTTLSRNIIIENTPNTTRENASGDWKNNAHIRTIEDAETYYNSLKNYGFLLQNEQEIYGDWATFKAAMAKASNDPALSDDNARHSEALQKAETILGGKGEVIIRLLNADSYMTGRALDISTDGFKIASSVIFKGVDMRLSPETDLTYQDDAGKEKDKVASSVLNPEQIMLDKTIDPIVRDFADEIIKAREIADAEQRDAELNLLLEATTHFGRDVDLRAIRNIIANEREGTKRSIERKKQIQKNLDRIERYNELEEGSTEQLSERRKLIRYYEQIRNFRSRLIEVEGGSEYYDSLLKSVVKVGGFHSRMAQNFSTAYNIYNERSEAWSPEQKAKYDSQLNKLKEYREHFLTRKNSTANVIHMEYPGYYKHYELLYNMLRNWIAGHPAITQDYLTSDPKNKTFQNPKSFAAAQTEIIDFINNWENDTEFRRSIATREKVKSYTQIRSIRGATFTKPDLDMFTQIPEELQEINTFPKAARDLYTDLSQDVNDLANVLSDEELVTDLTREFGDNYVYNLQRLYNQLVMPDISDFRSESRKDLLLKVRTTAAKASGKTEAEIEAIKESINKRMSKKSTYAQASREAEAAKKERITEYRKHQANYALRLYDELAAGDSVTDEERSRAIKGIGIMISNYLWHKKDGDVGIFDLSRAQKYKVITAITDAYYSFLENPKTDRSIEKFEEDVNVALEEMKINRTIPGDPKHTLLSIGSPKKGLEIDDTYISKRLQPILDGEIKNVKNIYEEVEAFRNKALTEENILDDIVESYDTPLERLVRNAKARRKLQSIRSTATVVSGGNYNVKFNENTKEFEDFNGNKINSDKVDTRRLTQEEFDKYLNYQIYNAIENGYLKVSKAGNLLNSTTNRIKFFAYELPLSNKYYKTPENTKVEASSTIPTEEDFEPNETPDENDFVSEFIEDPGEFEPMQTKEKIKQPRGSWEDTLPKAEPHMSALSNNTRKMLSYVYNKKPETSETDAGYNVNTKDFLEDNAQYLNIFNKNINDITAFIEWVESSPSIPIDSPAEANLFALLNQIANNINAPENLRKRAKNLITRLGSRAGRQLGMLKSFGLTPVDQMIGFISQYMKLTDEELEILGLAADMQRNAIKLRDYKAAEASMQKVLEIVKKHEAELPISCNIFAKGLTDEERSTRMHNIIEKITSWRYFAMLGAPSTFFAKNMVSNVIITGMDKVSELIASKLPQGEKLSQNYSFDEKDFGIIFGLSDKEYKKVYKQEYDKLVKEIAVDSNGNPRALTEKEIEVLENKARNKASDVENERRKSLVTLTTEQVQAIVNKVITNADDLKKININDLTRYINNFIETRHKTDGKTPTASKITARANEYLLKKFGQYTISSEVQEGHRTAVKKLLIDNGLIDAIMNDSVSKYDRGYDVKSSALRQITLDAEGKLDDISEREASILADTINKNAPFKWELLNKYYRFIFKTMEWGDKKFIRPKIISTVEKLVASNMTSSEIQDLLNGERKARNKFEDFVMYATNDAMKTYFRENTDFYKKLIQLFPKNPVAQLILGTIMPFPRMIINTMNTALSYSPVGFIKAWLIARKDTDAFTRLKINKELGKAITGSSLITIGAILAAAGIIGFDDDDEYGGAQIIIADKIRISLSDLAPSAIPLVIGATITHSATEGFWSAATSGANALLDATILGEAINIFGGNQSSADFIANSFTSYINQFIPSIFRHIARTIDPTKKDYSSNKAIKVFQRVAAAIPGLSLTVPSEVDPYTGEAIYQNAEASEGWARILSFFNMFSPAKITTNIESAIEIESKAVDAITTGPAKTYTIDGVQYEIPDELYKEYQILRAKLYSSYANNIINTTAYKNMSLTQKRAKLKQLQNKATQEARKQLNIGK